MMASRFSSILGFERSVDCALGRDHCRRFVVDPMANFAQISYSKARSCAGVHHFSQHPSFSEHRICAMRFDFSLHFDTRQTLSRRGCAMFVDRIKSPRCPKCGAMMSMRIIEPEGPGFDSRAFECPKCYDTEAFVASISHEINVSVGPACRRLGSFALLFEQRQRIEPRRFRACVRRGGKPGACSDDANAHP
jgi:hypothetical protein